MDAEFAEAAQRAVYALKAASDCFMIIQSETDDLAHAMAEWMAAAARDLELSIACDRSRGVQ